MPRKMLKNCPSLIYASLFIILAVLGCGVEANDKKEMEIVESTLAKKALDSKHRAFDHFSKADLYERSGNLEKAADEYRLALFYDPESDELKRSLAAVLYNLQRYDEAIDIFNHIESLSIDDRLMLADCNNRVGAIEKALREYLAIAEADSAPEPVLSNLAEFYARNGDLSKAEKYYSRLISTSENSDYWRLELASTYLRSNKIQKAIKIYKEMIETDSLNYSAYLGLAGVWENNNDPEKADSLYSLVAENNWDDVRILNMLLPAFMNIGDDDMALKVARRVIELFPEDYLAQRRYALLLFTVEDFDRSDSVLTELVRAVVDDPIAYYYRGRIAQFKEQYPLAESLYIQSITYDDTIHQAWINLAFARNSLGGYDYAMATFDSALTYCADDSIEIMFYIGVFLSREEKYIEAIDYYQRILAVEPADFDVKFNLAAAYERSQQYEKAETLFIELLDTEPDNPTVLNYLGYMYADIGIKLGKAEKMIKKALKISPDNGAYLDSYAWVMYKMGKYKKALKYQLMALKASGDDAILYDHMGDIYSALDKTSEAQTNWQRALELDPDNVSIKEKLK